MPALLTSPVRVSLPSAAAPCSAPRFTAAVSVTSKISGVKLAPNSFFSRSASASLRTEPNTLKPFLIRTLAQPQPMPVEAPVTTTDFMAMPLGKLRRDYSRAAPDILPRLRGRCLPNAKHEADGGGVAHEAPPSGPRRPRTHSPPPAPTRRHRHGTR